MLVHKNIRFLRTQAGLTQQQFADKIGLGRPLIGQLETGRVIPTLAHLERFSEIFHVSIDELVKHDLASKKEVAPKDIAQKDSNPRILAITVDAQNEELIPLVPQKASAGYLNGFSDPEYIAQLPQINLPNLRNGTFRAFEISGDSMLPVLPGSIIIGRYLADLESVKNDKTYLVISNTDGVVYKRVKINEKGNSLTLISDNPVYPPYEIAFSEIVEIWEAKAYISFTLPSPGISLDGIAGMLQEITEKLKK